MNKLYTLLILIFFQFELNAQHNEVRNCGTNEYMQQLELSHPEIVRERQAIEQHTHNFLQQPGKKTRTIITIPVVVHVVYNAAAQNISNAQINSQIAVLNKDFRKLNTDFASTPGIFQPIAADCQIEFVLAKRDPNGDSTTGITRTATAVTTFSNNNLVKNSATGGKSPWPSTSYLNIWVCKLSGGLLGYGQFPGGPAATDGVVISFKAFGTTGAALPPFNKGRTATHEIGHWLNLYHIWGDDGGNCNGTDLVNDTPNQGAENTGVPSYPHISCNNLPFGDMFMNYMDYTDDAAMTMFSAGQKTRMDALFAPGGSRVSLLTSQGGNYPLPPPPPGCTIPSNIATANVTHYSAEINWNANANFPYTVAYKRSVDSVWNFVNTALNSIVLQNLIPNTSYQYKVKTICGDASSAYSVVSVFTTEALPAFCTNTFEPNNSLQDAVAIDCDSTIHSMIDNNSDEDYFKIEVSETAPNIQITLSDLPQNYDLFLYTFRGSQLSSSESLGLSNEVIIYNSNYNGAATYYVGVKGSNGSYSNTNCYQMHVATSANNFRQDLMPTQSVKAPLMLYPVPATEHIISKFYSENTKEILCNIYNSFGLKIATRALQVQTGENELKFETITYASGIYLFEILDGDQRHVQKFQVSH